MATDPKTARTQADRILKMLFANITDWDAAVVRQAYEAIGADGRPFSMNDIRDLLPPLAHGVAGLVLRSDKCRRPSPLIKVGEVTSTSGPTHGKAINVYVLAAAAPAARRSAAA